MKTIPLFLLILFMIPAQAQIINTVAGKNIAGYSGDGGSATAAELNHPIEMAIDGSGNLFITDEYNQVVRKVTTAGIITTIAGNGFGAGTTTGGYSGDGGLATDAELSDPIGISISTSGDIFIAEQGNQIIRKVAPSGIISTVAGNGMTGYSGDGGPATSATLNQPSGVTVDGSGNFFIAEYGNNVITKVSTFGIITTVAGNGMSGYSGDGSAATNAKLHSPSGVTLDNSGNIYIADEDNNLVRKVNTMGIITTVAGNGMAGYSGDGHAATSANLGHPTDIAIDAAGNLYIAQQGQNVIRRVDTSGIITTLAGTGEQGYSGDGGPATAAMINDALGVVLNGSGNLFIADFMNNVIRKVMYHTEAVYNINYTLQNIAIYPNPSSDKVTIKTTDKIKSIEMITLIGQEVYEQSYSNTGTAVMDISCFPIGMYFIKLNGMYAGKFVKE